MAVDDRTPPRPPRRRSAPHYAGGRCLSQPAAAVDFFAGGSLDGEVWADGLEQRDGTWWPRFDVDVMARTLGASAGQDYWDAWEAIACPALVVRAGDGIVASTDAQQMARRGRRVTLVELAQAKHDVHLDRPDEWRSALPCFLDSLDST